MAPTSVRPHDRPIVRPAEPGDWSAIGELTVAAYVADGLIPADDPYADELRDVADRAERATVLVAADGAGVVLGSVTYCRPGTPYSELAQPDESEFRMLAVHPAHRGRGAGVALVTACLDRAREAGDAAVILCTLDVTASAQHIYQRLGFEPAPERDWQPRPGMWLRAYRCALPGR